MAEAKGGWLVHGHHDTLFEYNLDIRGRIKDIKDRKPNNEVPTRLRLLKRLTKSQIRSIPARLIKEGEAYSKSWEAYSKSWEAYSKAREAYSKAREAYSKALKFFKPRLEKLHKTFCGCEEWNGMELVLAKRR